MAIQNINILPLKVDEKSITKTSVQIAWGERKDNKYKEEQTGHSCLSIPRYNLLLLFCLPNMSFLSYIVAEISLTTNVEKKKKGHIHGRINMRMPVLNPTTQQVIVNMYNVQYLTLTHLQTVWVSYFCNIVIT